MSATGGNLYLQVDGHEYGQLFIYTVDGEPRLELGQFRPEHHEWRPTNPLVDRVADLIARHDEPEPD
jgi:hypothetical protein